MVLLTLSTVVLGTGTVFVSRAAAPAGRLARLVVVLVLTQAGIVVSGLFVGTVQEISGPALAAAATVLGLAMASLGWRLPRQRWRRKAPNHEPTAVTFLASGALALAILQHGWRAYQAVRFPILDWDGLSYHLVTVDVWLQEGGFGAIPQRIFSDGYPAHGELLTLWLMAFTGTDSLADLTSVVTVPLLVAATALVSRELGASRSWALVAGATAGLVPAAVILSSTTYVDVPAASASMAGLALLLVGLRVLDPSELRRDEVRTRAVIWCSAGLALGLAAGTKLTAAALVAVASVGLVVILAHRHRRGMIESLRPVYAAGIIAIAMGAFWYVDNLLSHGNPFYPFALGPFSGPLSAGDVASVYMPEAFERLGTVERVMRSWTADFSADVIAYDVRPGGFGWLWPTVLLPSATAWTVVALVKRRWTDLLVVALPIAASTAVSPMPWWARLTLTVTSFGAVAFGVLATNASRALKPTPRTLRVSVASLVATGLLTALVGNAWAISRTTNHPGRVGPDPDRVLTVREVLDLSRKPPDELRQLVSPWRSCTKLEELPAGSRLGTTGVTHPHLLVGTELARTLAPQLPGPPRSTVELEGTAMMFDLDYVILEERRYESELATHSSMMERIAGGVCGEHFAPLAIYRVRKS